MFLLKIDIFLPFPFIMLSNLTFSSPCSNTAPNSACSPQHWTISFLFALERKAAI